MKTFIELSGYRSALPLGLNTGLQDLSHGGVPSRTVESDIGGSAAGIWGKSCLMKKLVVFVSLLGFLSIIQESSAAIFSYDPESAQFVQDGTTFSAFSRGSGLTPGTSGHYRSDLWTGGGVPDPTDFVSLVITPDIGIVFTLQSLAIAANSGGQGPTIMDVVVKDKNGVALQTQNLWTGSISSIPKTTVDFDPDLTINGTGAGEKFTIEFQGYAASKQNPANWVDFDTSSGLDITGLSLPVPEPSTYLAGLFALGISCWMFFRKKWEARA